MFRYLIVLIVTVLVLLAACQRHSSYVPQEIAQRLPDRVDFNFHVKPILTDRCFSCHGPDEKTRKAGLRFDTEAGLFGKTTKGQALIDPGSPANSVLIQRLFSSDPELMMPPPESHLTLSPYEKAVLYTWVDQGAEWKKHWAFLPPEKVKPPKVRQKDWVQNPVDQFVLARLEQEGIAPSPKADQERLLRRVYLDLTGLPPSPEETDAFLADSSPEAFEKIVDRLLDTDAFAERMTMEWLDVARYADSHGYHADGWRSMYPWRDWVISAFRRNMPFDQFVTWQLAGDLLPDASEEQILATGFNRNHQISAEGGIVDEEYRLEYVYDRIHTTATAFLGMTMKCAQCHDHKFDPISQEEFYRFSAFFNQVDELGMNTDDGNCGPTILLLPDSTKARLAHLTTSLQELRQEIISGQKAADIPSFLANVGKQSVPREPKGLVRHVPMESIGSGRNEWGPEKRADRNAETPLEGTPQVKPGKTGNAICFDNEYQSLFMQNTGLFERNQPFSAGAWVMAEEAPGIKTILCNSGDKNNLWRGWDFLIDSTGVLVFRLIHALPHDQARIESTEPVPFGQWIHAFVTYDGSGKAEGMRIFLDGKPLRTTVKYDQLERSILPVDGTFQPDKRSLRAGKWNEGFSGEIGFLKGCFDEIRIYDRELSRLEVAQLAGGSSVETALASGKADPEAVAEYVRLQFDPAYGQLQGRLRDLVGQSTSLLGGAVEVQVMDDDRPRPTFVLDRGVYTERKQQVEAGVPAAILPFDSNLPTNRLGLAQWILSRDNPLTSRVTVNRYWQLFFGKGLVATPHDFGNQGALPSHPELLDWLAVEFMDQGWDVRHLIRLIVLSATYQQSSLVREDLEEVDPQNILLARGPAFRLPAEMIRDHALAASGLLVKRVGGEPVKPYQPDNIWGEKSFFSHRYLSYEQDSGANLYRRSMYTILKRTSPHPAMITLDGNDRSYCIVMRPTTNTPLQALVLLNDPTYGEASRVLAENMQLQGGEQTTDRIRYAFRRLTGRKPVDKEIDILVALYQQEKDRFRNAPDQARALLSVGEAPVNPALDPVETAAFAVVNSTILNHDESYMRR